MTLAIAGWNQAYTRCYRISCVGHGGVLIWANYLVEQALVATSERALA